MANLDKDRNKRLGFEEELLVDSSGNNSSPTITMLDQAKKGTVANVLFPDHLEEDDTEDQMMDDGVD